MRELLTLLEDAGHGDFREARGPMGFTQRQAAGRFTRDEATGFIDRLHDADSGGPGPVVTAGPRLPATDRLIRRIPSEQLAAELERRGGTVVRP